MRQCASSAILSLLAARLLASCFCCVTSQFVKHDLFRKSVPTFPDHALPGRDKAAMGQSGHDPGRDRLRLDALGIVGIASDPDAGFEAFDRERAVMGKAVLDLEARAAAADHCGFDRDLVAEPGWQPKSRPGLNQRVTGKFCKP